TEALPAEWLRLSGSFSYMHSEYISFSDGGVDVSNDRTFTYAPEFTGSVTVDARLCRGDWGQLHVLVDYRHASHMFNATYSLSANVNTGSFADGGLIAASDKIDLRLIASDIPIGRTNGEVNFWIRNLTDQREISSTTPLGVALGNLVETSFGGNPRT